MPDGTILPPTPAPTDAAAAGDATRARPLAEQHLEALGDLVGIGLKIARAIERQVDAVGSGPLAIAELNAAAIAFARVARAVRQTIMLQNRLLEGRGAAAAGAGDVKGAVARIVRCAIEDEFGRAAEIERLTAEAGERLEHEFGEDGPARPVGAIVADICKALGLAPDWRGLAADIAAAEAFAAAGAHAAGGLAQDDGPGEICWIGPDGRWTPVSKLRRKQPAVVAEAAVLRRAHQQLHAVRTKGEGLVDVAFAVRHHGDPPCAGADRGGLVGALQPAEALLLLHRQGSPLRFAPAGALQELAVHQAQDRPVPRVQRHHRMQVVSPAALRADHRRVLDHQNIAALAALRRLPARLSRHLLRRHRAVAQKPRQPDFPGPIPAQTTDPQSTPPNRQQTGQQIGPPFSSRRSPNRPSVNSISAAPSPINPQTESDTSDRFNPDV
jgi:hypothetical protein